MPKACQRLPAGQFDFESGAFSYVALGVLAYQNPACPRMLASTLDNDPLIKRCAELDARRVDGVTSVVLDLGVETR